MHPLLAFLPPRSFLSTSSSTSSSSCSSAFSSSSPSWTATPKEGGGEQSNETIPKFLKHSGRAFVHTDEQLKPEQAILFSSFAFVLIAFLSRWLSFFFFSKVQPGWHTFGRFWNLGPRSLVKFANQGFLFPIFLFQQRSNVLCILHIWYYLHGIAWFSLAGYINVILGWLIPSSRVLCYPEWITTRYLYIYVYMYIYIYISNLLPDLDVFNPNYNRASHGTIALFVSLPMKNHSSRLTNFQL